MQINIGKIQGEVIKETYIDAVFSRLGVRLVEPISDDDVKYLTTDARDQFYQVLDEYGVVLGQTTENFENGKTGLPGRKMTNQKHSDLANVLPHSDRHNFMLHHPADNGERKCLTGISGIVPSLQALIKSLPILINDPTLTDFKSTFESWQSRLAIACSKPHNLEDLFTELNWFARMIRVAEIPDELLFKFLQSVENELDAHNAVLKVEWHHGDIVFISRRVLHFRIAKTIENLWEKNSVIKADF